MRPRLLDMFCGAGGAGKGYADAGFDVLGIDIEPQPNYPYEFIQGDALAIDLRYFDAVHASPPCPRYSRVSSYHGVRENHPDLIIPVRDKLDESGLPYIIENVPGAPLRRDLVLCGEMFGLRVHRHRLFEVSGFACPQPAHLPHLLKGAKTNNDIAPDTARGVYGHYSNHADASEAMGIDWMDRGKELANAIPPAYTRHIGGYLLEHVLGVAESQLQLKAAA